jgi:hypothetical protein
MPDTGNEVAESEAPVASLLEPGMRLIDVFLFDAEILSVAMDQCQAKGSAEDVTDGNAGSAAAERGQPCWN